MRFIKVYICQLLFVLLLVACSKIEYHIPENTDRNNLVNIEKISIDPDTLLIYGDEVSDSLITFSIKLSNPTTYNLSMPNYFQCYVSHDTSLANTKGVGFPNNMEWIYLESESNSYLSCDIDFLIGDRSKLFGEFFNRNADNYFLISDGNDILAYDNFYVEFENPYGPGNGKLEMYTTEGVAGTLFIDNEFAYQFEYYFLIISERECGFSSHPGEGYVYSLINTSGEYSYQLKNNGGTTIQSGELIIYEGICKTFDLNNPPAGL